MFIRFFKSSFVSQYVVIGIIGLLLWARSFITPPSIPLPDGPVPLYALLYRLLQSIPVVAVVAGFLLVLLEAYWLNFILDKHELIPRNSSLSALVFLILMSFTPDLLVLNPVNLSILFLIIISQNLLISYKKPRHLDRLYAAGFFTSIASMVYFPFILWFGLIIISFFVFRSGKWRQWMSSFIGFVTPFIFLSVFYFWFDTLGQNIAGYWTFICQILVFPNPFQTDFWILGSCTFLLSLYGLIRFWSGPVEKTVEIRSKTNLFLWMIFFTMMSFLFSRTMALYHPVLSAPAFTLVITCGLITLKKPRIMEWLLLIYFLAIMANNLLIHYYFSPVTD